MGAGLVVAAISFALFQQPDSATYDSPATRDLIARGMARHRAQDSSVADYQASIRYRLSFSLGRRRWANVPTLGVEEQEARIAWQRPNDLRVDFVGQRARARNPDWDLNSTFDEPWFVPRGLGDSVRTFGADFPERAALHPLAADGPDWYLYRTEDSVTIRTPAGRPIRLTAVRVAPRRPGGALIAGRMWLDTESGEVVRLAFRYVGTDLWVSPEDETHKDSSQATKANRLINRILSIDSDLEYALLEGKYWMPYRQILSGRVQIPFIGDYVVPFEAVTSFRDYQINTGKKIAFTLPAPDTSYRRTVAGRRARRDSLEAERKREPGGDDGQRHDHAGYAPGGRYEIHRPPRDSLKRYAEWGDTLKLELAPEDDRRVKEVQDDLARMVDRLPNDITGLRGMGFGYERLADILRYNRVSGWSGGLGYQVPLGSSFSTLYGTARYGASDHRITARLSFIRDAPGGRLTVSAYRDLTDVDPFSKGLTFGNSIRAIFEARDEADYYLASGAAITHESSLGRGVDLTVGLRGEHQESVVRRAKSGVNDFFFGDGLFPANPPIDAGDFLGASVKVDGLTGRTRWSVALDGLAGRVDQGARFHASARQPFLGRRGFVVRGAAGVGVGPAIAQLAYRAGGQGTVRGFDYGTERGPAFWSVQTDFSPLRGTIRPVLFIDAGQAGPFNDLTRQPVMVGGGVGLSALAGLIRLDLSRRLVDQPALRARGGFRVDIVFGAAR